MRFVRNQDKVYQPDFGGLCSSEFVVMPETSAVRGQFLKYRLNSGDFVKFSSDLNTGDRPRVDFNQIRAFLITYGVPWKGTVPQRVRNPPGKLSLQPVAIGADDGGNDIVRSTSVERVA